MEKRAELSPRLQGVAEMIPEGARLADVGTDHAYLPAWLLQNGRIPSAIASDVREGPLSRARATARACGCFERMSFRLCDGLSGIAPEEVDALVIAGMGGETIANILEAAPWVKEKDFPIILQPMSTQAELRGWLWRNGFLCLREKTVFEGETLYSIILARQGGAVPMTPAEEWAGRQYPGMEDPLRGLLLDHLLGRVRRALDGMARSRAPAEARRRELEQVLEGLMELRKEWDAWQQR